MMKYSNYTVEDFVLDDYFRKWSNNQLPSEDTFWEDWLETNKDKTDLVLEAKLIIQSIEFKHQGISESRIEEKATQILKLIDEKRIQNKNIFDSIWLKIAAATAILLGISWYYFVNNSKTPPYENMANSQKRPMLEKINTTDQAIKINLSDGSVITLEPKSKLSYPETFAKDKREVYLEGEGFFKISKNPNRPFLVYANELVTKVLGTSFSINAYENSREVTVKVFTGKVSVLSSLEKLHESNKPFSQAEGVILTANQMVVFSRNDERLAKTLVENPIILNQKSEEKINFDFQNAPVSEVFKTLEKAYGVEIVFNEELLKNCQITAPLSNETLFEKLDLICKVIRANYEVVDAQVIITSKGCI